MLVSTFLVETQNTLLVQVHRKREKRKTYSFIALQPTTTATEIDIENGRVSVFLSDLPSYRIQNRPYSRYHFDIAFFIALYIDKGLNFGGIINIKNRYPFSMH